MTLPERDEASARGIAGVLRRTFRSLHVRNYRLYFIGQIISQSGTWMQSVAQGWLVFDRLTHHNAFLLGVTVSLQFAPVLLVGPWGGLIADRVDKRKLLLATQSTSTALAAVLGVLTVAGVVRVWMVFVLAGLNGLVNALDNPSRQAFVIEMVGPDDLINAVGLNSVIVNGSRIVGPALAGLLIVAANIAAPFFFNAVSFLFVIAALLAMRPAELSRSRPVKREKGQLRAGFAYVWHTPELLIPVGVMAVVGTLGYNFSVLLPLMAKIAFHRGAGTFSSMLTVMGLGALPGALFAASRRRPTRRLLVVATIAFGAVSIMAAAAPTLLLEYVLLWLMGIFSVLFVSTTNSLLQLGSEPAMRGRVMSLWAMVFLGTTPIGSLSAGLVASAFGPRVALGAGGVASMLAGVGVYGVLRRGRLRRAAAAPGAYPQVGLPDNPAADEEFAEALLAERDATGRLEKRT